MDYIFSSANPRIEPIYFVAAAIAALLAGLISAHNYHHGKRTRAQSLAATLLTAYVFLVFASTVFSRTPGEYYSYELIPFWSYREIVNGSEDLFWEDVLNVILLIPMGILLPIVLERVEENKKFWKTVLIGFLTSLAIEFLQLTTKKGLFEFDDMFHNTIGVATGYWIYRTGRKRRK